MSSSNPFKISAVDFIEQIRLDMRESLRREPDIRVEAHEKHQERFNPNIYQGAPSMLDKAFHRQSYLKARERDSCQRVEKRRLLEVSYHNDAVASYKIASMTFDRKSFDHAIARLYRQRDILTTARFKGHNQHNLIEALNHERNANYLATVLYERNPHAFATNPVLSIAALPAYSWPQLMVGHHSAISIKA